MQSFKADKPSMEPQFYVTRESQQSKASPARKTSYIGIRDLSDLDKIEEKDIVSHRGTIRGIKNRVRAGLANFENPTALRKKSQEGGKVIIYTTSFRGVRSTYEECKYVLSVFHNLRVRVEERDVYVHTFYYNELMERLQRKSASVPQVFISGQHIGGAEDLESLNESGELRRLLADFPRYETANNCKLCAGYRFVPCNKCGGSKNSVANNFTMEFRALRCTHCNENGLEPCPECTLKEEEEKNAREKEEEKNAREKEEGTVKTAKEQGKARGDLVKMESEKEDKREGEDEQVKGGERGDQENEVQGDQVKLDQEDETRDQWVMEGRRTDKQEEEEEEEGERDQVKMDREEDGELGMSKEQEEENWVDRVKMDREEDRVGEVNKVEEEENGVGQLKTDMEEENGNQGTMYKEEEEEGDQMKNKEEEREDRWKRDKEEEEEGDQETTYIGEEEEGDRWREEEEEERRDQETAYIWEKEEGEDHMKSDEREGGDQVKRDIVANEGDT